MSAGKSPIQYPNPLPDAQVRARLLETVPREADLESALELIHAKLAQATMRLEGVSDDGRLGVAMAMDALVSYFSSVGVPYAALAPIIEVAGAIVDAKRGVANPIFRPDRNGKAGAPPTAALDLQFDGHLAVVVDCCVAHCKAQGHRPFLMPGCELAAKLIAKSGWGVKPTANELRRIRERVIGSGADSPDTQLFRIMKDSPLARDSPLAWAKSLLNHEWVNRRPADNLSNPPV